MKRGMRASSGWCVVGLAAATLTACYAGADPAEGDPQADGGDTADDGGGGDDDDDDDDADGDDDDDDDEPEVGIDEVPMIGMRRLTAAEYFSTVQDLLEAQNIPAFELLPLDARTPFDNDYREQTISETLINAADFLAEHVATDLIEDPPRMADVVGCDPSGPDDEACMREFIERFGRRALRRPLEDSEIEEYLHGTQGDNGAIPYALLEDDFAIGVEFVVRAMLQEPEFLYRIEIGEPVGPEPGLYRLGPYEVASRLSFLLWGTGPDEELLDLAAADMLSTADERRAAAQRLFADDRARGRIERFHAQWLGYELMPFGGELAAEMQAETRALLGAVIWGDETPWQDVLRADGTYVSDTLAEHYGLTPPGSDEPTWTPYGDSGRRGLLSHGSFLTIGTIPGDTSPVVRGVTIRERLLCQEIPPPPPGVDVDEEPAPEEGQGFCKRDRYSAHAEADCAGCHDLIDSVGFGLEQYDQLGRFREFEPDDPDTEEDESTCAIDGVGELSGLGEFSGPGELGELALETGLVAQCLVTQMHRFTVGRGELDWGGADADLIESIATSMGEGDFTFEALVLEVVGDPTFGYRHEDGEEG